MDAPILLEVDERSTLADMSYLATNGDDYYLEGPTPLLEFGF